MNRMTKRIERLSYGIGMVIVASLAMAVVASLSSQVSTAAPPDKLTFASPQDAADHAYREAYGAYAVIEMHALVQDYYKGILRWSDVMRQIMADHPKLARTVFETNASEKELCLMSSLIMSQSNGPIAVTQDGMPVYFDTAAFVDEDGFVIPAFARDYNTAIRANQIMVDTLMAFAFGECRVPPLNNRCCKLNPLANCKTVETGSRCAMAAGDLACEGSSTNCP